MSRQLFIGIINQIVPPVVVPPIPPTVTGFTTQWQTTAPNESIIFPSNSSAYPFNATIYWGDNSSSVITTYNDPALTHTYAVAGTYNVNVVGEYPGWTFQTINNTKLKKVLSWGAGHFGGFEYLNFYYCTQLNSLPASGSIVVKPTFNSLQSSFRSCTSLTSIPSGIFNNIKSINSILYAFGDCTSLQTVPSGLFNTITGGTNIYADNIFTGCVALQSIPAGIFDVFGSRLATYGSLPGNFFNGCTTLTSIPADLFKYNSNLTSMYQAFYGCNHITSIPAGLFSGSSKITSFANCFYNCSALTGAIPTNLFANNKIAGNTTGAQGIFYNCSQLSGAIPAGLFDHWSGMTSGNAGFKQTFYGCSSLTSIPSGLFDKMTLLSGANCFTSTFAQCTSLTSIPTDLFRYNTLVGGSSDLAGGCFYQTFQNNRFASIPADLFKYNTDVRGFIRTLSYNRLSSIPAGLFSGNTKVTIFDGVFGAAAPGGTPYSTIPANLFANNKKVVTFQNMFGNSLLTSIPSGLFDAFTGCTTYYYNFNQCNGLTTIPAGLYDKSTLATSITFEYANCQNLTSIPADLFKYNTLVTSFSNLFSSCYNLLTVPQGLFSGNTNCTNFNATFSWCKKLQLNPYIFDASGVSGSTRFLNKSVNFTQCFWFYAGDLPYTGVQGTAPELWGYNFGSGTPTKTSCFTNRDNVACLTNYADIPLAWRA